MDLHVRVRQQKRCGRLASCGREIVGDHVNLAAVGLTGDDVAEKTGDDVAEKLTNVGLGKDTARAAGWQAVSGDGGLRTGPYGHAMPLGPSKSKNQYLLDPAHRECLKPAFATLAQADSEADPR
jgi:hypothetical protein